MSIDFPGRRADEQVTVCQHRHWLFLLPDILITLVMAVLPIGALALLSAVGAEPFGNPGEVVTATVLGIYYLALVTFFFIRWLDFYLDLAIVTDKRVVDIDQHGLFNRNVAELEYEAVQDVSAAKHGILQTLFNFGDVEIQTAGEKANFTFRTVARPEEIVDRINAARDGASTSEDKAAEEMRQAAEQMKEAAEQIKEAPVAQGNSNGDQSSDDQPGGGQSSGRQSDPSDRTQPSDSADQTGDAQNEDPAKQSSDDADKPPPPSPPPSDNPVQPPPPDSPNDLPREFER